MKRRTTATALDERRPSQRTRHSATTTPALLSSSSPSDDDHSAAATAFREGAVRRVAILSRVLMLLIAIVFGEMFDDFDSSAHVEPPLSSPTKLDALIHTSVGHLARWDSVYFVHIAQHGYSFEHFHAFFPALPLGISFLNRTFLKVLWVKGFASEYNSAVLGGVFITNVFFVLSAVELYRLSKLVVKKESFATKTVLLYCLTPANIFMSAVYSESVFAFFFLRGVRLLLEHKRWESALTLAGTCLTRSNGALCCLFLVYDALQRCPPPFLRKPHFLFFVSADRPSWLVWIGTALRCVVIVAPMVGYLTWSYFRYCTPTNPTRDQHEWCDALVPDVYSYVQAKYWNVGFLKYYELKQIPNFLLASPIVFLSSWGILSYLRRFPFFSSSSSSSSPSSSPSSPSRANSKKKTMTPSNTDSPASSPSSSSPPSSASSSSSSSSLVIVEPYYSGALLPFVVYWAVLLVVGVLFMHVQVITRFMSSCAPFYWFCASFYDEHDQKKETKKKRKTKMRSWMQYLIAFYFLSYTLIGALLFCNFYPWT